MEIPIHSWMDRLNERLAARRWRVMLGVLLLAVLPRAVVALQLEAFCYDSYYYFYVAGHLEQGDPQPLLEAFNLNLYPLILVAGHKLGLPWAAAGQIWGVAVGSLLILPLYGAVRRMFDDRLAAIACALYGVHPELIEYAAEPIRDPTYWFLATSWLYAIVRAWRETRWRWFAAAGFLFALAAHTRSEGWLLLCVPGVWWLRDVWQSRQERWKLAAGSVLALAITPLLILLVNVTVLRDQPQPYYGRLLFYVTHADSPQRDNEVGTKSHHAGASLRSSPGHPLVSANHRGIVLAVAPTPAPPVLQRATELTTGLIETFGYINAALLLFGIGWCRRHRVSQGEPAGFYLYAGLLFAAVWVFYSRFGETNDRYFLSIVLLLLPLQAMGFLGLIESSIALRKRWNWNPRPGFVVGSACLVIAGVNLGDALSFQHNNRNDDVALARWIAGKCDGPPSLYIDRGAMRVGFHINDEMPPKLNGHGYLMNQFGDDVPEWLIVSKSKYDLSDESLPLFDGNVKSLGWAPVDISRFPRASRRHFVYRRVRRVVASGTSTRR